MGEPPLVRCLRGGVNEVTLFRHFGNKENLFSELVRTYSLIPEILDLSVREKHHLRTRSGNDRSCASYPHGT